MGRKGYRRGAQAAGRLTLEPLEERIAPAGAVVVTNTGGYLVFTGDGEANDITIDQVGLAAGEYRISSGLDATTINGEASIVIAATKGMKFAMGEGSDTVNIDTVATGALTFDGGEGDNTFGMNDTTVTGALTVKNGSGFDTTNLDGTISGAVAITNGDGGSDVSFGAAIAGKASVKNGAGDDIFYMKGSIGKNLDIADGAGASDIGIDGMVGGNVTIKDGDGAQIVRLSGSETGKVTISHGAGDSGLIVDGDAWAKSISVTTKGAGTHSIAMSAAEVGGALSFSNSVGNSLVDLDTVTIGGAVSIKNGLGLDTVDAVDADMAALTIKNGDGGSALTFDSCFVAKGFSITNGAGENDLGMIWSEVVGSTSVKNGDGDSTISIAFTYLGFDLDRPGGGVKLQSGAGIHEVVLTVAVGKTTSVTMGGTTMFGMINSMFGGNVTVKTGDGDDSLAFAEDCEFAGGLSVSTGDGNDSIRMDDIWMRKNLAVSTGDGNDVLTMETSDVEGGPSTFRGKISLLMGAGDDTVVAGLDADLNNYIDASGAVLADGGTGTDSITAGDSNIFAGEPVLKGFEIVDVPLNL